LAGHVEHIFLMNTFVGQLAVWAGTVLLFQPYGPNEEPVCARSDAFDAHPAYLRGGKFASAFLCHLKKVLEIAH
jgi:hypothetical protein